MKSEQIIEILKSHDISLDFDMVKYIPHGEYEKIASEICQLHEAEITEIIETLIKAKELIKAWHCMGMSEEITKKIWGIYEDMSPEMKPINELLKKYQYLKSKP